jgi:hypothetical protein
MLIILTFFVELINSSTIIENERKCVRNNTNHSIAVAPN